MLGRSQKVDLEKAFFVSLNFIFREFKVFLMGIEVKRRRNDGNSFFIISMSQSFSADVKIESNILSKN